MGNDKMTQIFENARIEYQVANNAYLHYDNFTWQVGGVLIAGSFVYWGFIFQSNAEYDSLSISNFLITVIMSIWILYSSHNRQIYKFKLDRIHELEILLGMEQNLRFKPNYPNGYPKDSLKGHRLNLAIYISVCIGNILVTASVKKWECPELVPRIFIVASIFSLIGVWLKLFLVGQTTTNHLKNRIK